METYENVVSKLCDTLDTEVVPPNIERAIRQAIEWGYGVMKVDDLVPGDFVAQVATDPFGFGPEADAFIDLVCVLDLTPGRFGSIKVRTSDGITEAYAGEYCLARHNKLSEV